MSGDGKTGPSISYKSLERWLWFLHRGKQNLIFYHLSTLEFYFLRYFNLFKYYMLFFWLQLLYSYYFLVFVHQYSGAEHSYQLGKILQNYLCVGPMGGWVIISDKSSVVLKYLIFKGSISWLQYTIRK